jgi:ATP-dependent RNA helicase SUPV3L1/SUV3
MRLFRQQWNAGACAGDVLEVRSYERLLPLVPQAAPVESLKKVHRGDCVVAFSRRDVHAIKRAIDSHGALKCCMVYGALPAEVPNLAPALVLLGCCRC